MNFEFQNADFCPAVKSAFGSTVFYNAEENTYLERAARHIDTACGILKRGYAHGSLSEHDYDEFLTQIEEAESHLEELGVLEDHDYIREDLEPRATELLNVDSIDVEDEAEDYETTDNWLFQRDDAYEE